jgi:hypothetical protein
MAPPESESMPDKEYRAILTDREKEIIRGEADVSEGYYYRVVSRVRQKIEELDNDLDVLAEHATLADELRDIVCGSEDTDRPD